MSEEDLSTELALSDPGLSQVQTSRLALFSMFSALVCIPGVSGLLGVVCGFFALRQIANARYITGANLAWAGILGGVFNLVSWGTLGLHVLEVHDQLGAPTERFFAAWSKSEADGESAAAPGLAPLMRTGGGKAIHDAFKERFGPFQSAGAPRDFGYKLDLKGERVSATFPLQFQSGAPISAKLEFVRQDGELRVVGYTLESVMLRDLAMRGVTEAHGARTPDLTEYDPGGAGGRHGVEIKSYRP